MKILSLITLLMSGLLITTAVHGKDIHKEKSLYRNIVVKEEGSRRCLVFTVKRSDRNQTCINLNDPQKLVFPYVRMSLAGLLLNNNPKRVLVVGLGGGSIPLTLAELFPEAEFDIVEIDPAVVRVAKEYFFFEESDRMRVHTQDARVYIKRAGLKGQTWDLIFLDAFTGEYIPEHLMTMEFLQETKAVMTDNGTLVANTFSTSDLYDHESVTYSEVFGDIFNLKLPITGNRVILASTAELPSDFLLKSRAKQFQARLRTYDVDIERYPNYMRRTADWDTDVRPLTDQYNPANLLQGDNH